LRVPRDRGQRRHRTNAEAAARGTANPMELADRAQAHEEFRLELAALHVRVKVGAARDDHGVGAVLAEQACRIGDGLRRDGREGRQAHHGGVPPSENGRTATASAGWPNAESTTSGSLNLNSGMRSGPTRGVLPWRFDSRPFRIFSGVIGTSSTRTPTASYTALAMAGITGKSGPCPASLAPNGPSGSSVATRIVWISGVSSVVGLLYSSIEGCLCRPLRKTCASMSASPIPM